MTPALRATPPTFTDPAPLRQVGGGSIAFRAGYKYVLAETYEIDTQILGYSVRTEKIILDGTGRLTIRKGYAWDGMSGPTWDTLNSMRGSLVHDAVYQLIRGGHIDRRHKRQADELFRRCCIEDGMTRFRAWYIWRAVDRAGDGATRASAERPVRRAP